MANAADIKIEENLSFLLIGDGGTHKTFFIGTCPSPIYVFDFDKGMAIHAGRADIDFDTFKELPKGEKARPGLYEWGKSWPEFMKKINEIGRSIDAGECKYKTLAIDSLTFCADRCMAYVIRQNIGNAEADSKNGLKDHPDQRDWGGFLNNMTTLFDQLTTWPLIKVLTAHVKRDEDPITNITQKLPLISGQSSGKIPTFFDEVYFTDAKQETEKIAGKDTKVLKWFLKSMPDTIHKQAKSRALNIPDGVETAYPAVMKARRKN